MDYSRHSDELSFLNDSDPNILAPIAPTQTLQKSPVFMKAKEPISKTSNSVINVLSPNRSTNKLTFNQQLIDYFAQDQNNSNLNIVTFLGPKQVGKSFLIDFIISKEEKATSRLLSKNPRAHINMPSFDVRGKNGEKIVFFDTHEDIPNDVFLWTYFFSSMVVLNLPQGDRKAQQQFLSKLDYVRISLQSEPDQLSLPQLIILRRDSNSKDFQDKEFLAKIDNYGLFASDIGTINMAYPGTNKVNSKDIKDVAQNSLNEAFVNDALNLTWTIKSGRPKTIKGNFIGTKIAGLALEPVTQSISKTGKIQTGKIWTDVIETLSVGYYNFYVKNYSEQLQRQFSDEQPCDKYTLYKRLSKIRRKVDKKFEGFAMISEDPTFEKYRSKVLDNISKKEKVIREINKRKSIQKNDALCKKLFSQMDDSNCEALIQQYCQSKLDDNKTQVLLNNFESVIKKRLNEVEKSKNPALKPSTQIQKLERQLKELEDKIKQQKQNKVQVVEYDFAKVQSSIQQKEKEVKELEEQLEKQKKISNEKRANQNKDIVELEQKIQGLRSTTREQETEIERLKAEKETQAQQQITKLNKKLKEEQDRYQKLQAQMKKVQDVSAIKQRETKPAAKDTCCAVM